MPKLRVEDLKKISERVRKTTLLREGAGRAKITVHMSTCGIASGARGIMTAFVEELEKKDLKDVLLVSSGCAGLCSEEPMITVEVKDQSPVKYIQLTPEKAVRILEDHVIGGNIVKEYALASGSERIM